MQAKKKHANIPIFIPHEGCGNACVFCSQRKITGVDAGSSRDIRPEIEKALSTINENDYETEIAFFGGSFTGIDRGLMISLLSTAYGFIESGRVSSIRISTRPDYIDEEILEILKKYSVKNIELGLQSMDDEVLSMSKRGHTAAVSKKACRMIVDNGFALTGQMMVGLPGSTAEKEVMTANDICSLGAVSARIYPTVVFYGTELYNMAVSGRYTPITNEAAAQRCAEAYKVFLKNNVKVLRVGLQSSENLSDESQVYAGANHPAIGEMCESRIYFDKCVEKIELLTRKNHSCTSILKIYCPYGEVSKVAGQKRINKKKIEEYCSLKNIKISEIKIIEKENIAKFDVETDIAERK